MLCLVNCAGHPIIVKQPRPIWKIAYGDEAKIEVEAVAQGTDLSYQWTFFDSPIPKATSSSYSISHVRDWDDGLYRCEVRNSDGEKVTSEPCNLILNGWS